MRIAILGGGAAGCFAAANIPQSAGHKVVVFEKTGKLLQKVKASGGGRCNVTHACFDVPELITRYPRGKSLLKKSLYRFSPRQTIDWFEARGIRLKTEPDGRVFPVSDNSQTVIDCIRGEMDRRNTEVRFHKAIVKIGRIAVSPSFADHPPAKDHDTSFLLPPLPQNDPADPLSGAPPDTIFRLYFADGTEYDADRVLVACGGHAREDGYHWLKSLGHGVQKPVPSLFTFNMPGNSVTQLMGVSVPDAIVKIPGTKFSERGPLLITHWGMSGPSVLRISAWAARELHEREYNFQVRISWPGDMTEEDLRDIIACLRREQGKQTLFSRNPFGLPKRLWEYLLHSGGIPPGARWGDLPAAHQNRLISRLLYDSYEVKGKTTFKEEFVTCGGISLNEINPRTMESRLIPGLYFAGEILDVDGITGGFNFQHAWSSAWITAGAFGGEAAFQ